MSIKNRKTSLLSLVILIPLALYVSGVVAQLIANINTWKAAGSNYNVSPGLPSFYPSHCLKALLKFPEGLIALGVVTVGIALFCIFGLHIGWGARGRTDADRNLTISHSGSYGTAAFMSKDEAMQCFDITTVAKTDRDILGMVGNGKVFTLPKHSRPELRSP